MKLISLLNIMDEDDEIEVSDENARVNEMVLFRGTVADCKRQGYFRNGVLTGLFAVDGVFYATVNIEYQKRKGRRKCDKKGTETAILHKKRNKNVAEQVE